MTVAPEPWMLVALTEREVAANTVWALVKAGMARSDRASVHEAVRVAGISVDDLRLASIRYDRFHRPVAPRAVRVVPSPERPAHVAPVGEATTPSVVSARTETRDAEVDPAQRKCRRCQHVKPEEEFARLRGRLKWWCRGCSTAASVRVVQQRRSWEKAYVAMVLAHGDECVGMECERCGSALRVGDSMVVSGRPRHDRCP